jgi:hypothetical protein
LVVARAKEESKDVRRSVLFFSKKLKAIRRIVYDDELETGFIRHEKQVKTGTKFHRTFFFLFFFTFELFNCVFLYVRVEFQFLSQIFLFKLRSMPIYTWAVRQIPLIHHPHSLLSSYRGLVTNSTNFLHVTFSFYDYTATRITYFGYQGHTWLAIKIQIFKLSQFFGFLRVICVKRIKWRHNKGSCFFLLNILFPKLLMKYQWNLWHVH